MLHDNKLLFTVYKPLDVVNVSEFIETWRELALKHDLGDFYFVGVSNEPEKEKDSILNSGFDAVNSFGLKGALNKGFKTEEFFSRISRKFFDGKVRLSVYDYEQAMRYFNREIDHREDVIPTIFPNWDVSPRSGKRAIILQDSTPLKFEKHLENVKNIVDNKNNKLIFLKSWNEWAEGNYMEPDLKYGSGYLTAFKKIFSND